MSDTAAMLRELLEWALDACHQGTGSPFGGGPGWHLFESTYEDAEDLLPRVAEHLGLRIITVSAPRPVAKLVPLEAPPT